VNDFLYFVNVNGGINGENIKTERQNINALSVYL